ncbi:hypothetical protein HK104_009049 [Borealophlyctis nickersoniae]|nr:hypothetical protein HK104_009049 [Borealophlyctis nickersoniae]
MFMARPLLTSRPLLTRPFSSQPASNACWLVVAKDAKDHNALARRLEVREKHLARAAAAKKEGKVLVGGALLDENADRMIGSMMVLTVPTKKAVEEFIAEDVYVKNRVWETWEITPFRPAAFPK